VLLFSTVIRSSMSRANSNRRPVSHLDRRTTLPLVSDVSIAKDMLGSLLWFLMISLGTPVMSTSFLSEIGCPSRRSWSRTSFAASAPTLHAGFCPVVAITLPAGSRMTFRGVESKPFSAAMVLSISDPGAERETGRVSQRDLSPALSHRNLRRPQPQRAAI
jgi:hypothetical protein